MSPKIVSVTLVNPITFPGSTASGDTTINITKHLGVDLKVEGPLLVIKHRGKTAATPLSNVKSMLYE